MQILEENQVNKIKKYYDNAVFEQGLWGGKVVDTLQKNNLETDHTDKRYGECSDIISSSLEKNNDFINYLHPYDMSIVNFARYTEGMYYNYHNDNYTMTQKLRKTKIRTDYSCTLFLSSPEEYDGGELVLQLGNQTKSFKLESGYAIFYPTGCVHKVSEVTSGVRDVAIFWVQSKIRDAVITELLSDVYEITKEYGEQLNTREFDNLNIKLTHISMQLKRKFMD
jgi:PKHD-type hydroxylase